jgi:hypothetical protein
LHAIWRTLRVWTNWRGDRSASVIEILVEDIDRLAREVKEMKALLPVKKRKIGFCLGHEN